MADTSQAEQPSPSEPQTNGIPDGIDEDEKMKMRPADIDADMREMERRKRVEMIMNSRLFREELERIIETQLKDGSGPAGLLQQISDMMGFQGGRLQSGNVFRSSNCVVPINDIRGVESMGYAKGEKILRCKLAAVYRLMDLYGWTQGIYNHITARLNQDQEHFLVNPFGMLYHEITASSLVKIDMQGGIVESGTSNFGVNVAGFMLHSAIHAARPDIKCIIHVHTPSVLAVSSLKCGLLPLCQEAIVIGEVSQQPYLGSLFEPEEREKIARNLGPMNKVMFLANHGAVCCGETVEEAFYNVYNTVLACETQIKLMPMGVENLVLVSDESRKQVYEAARRAPDSAPKHDPAELPPTGIKKEKPWRIGGIEFEALMRMLDNAGFRTGYIYRHPLVKGELPRPRNDVEVPPAVSSLGYLLEEEEMYKHGQWKKYMEGRKTHDRTRWLNSPNVYQKVEILETGTPDPKKITKWVEANAEEWVADGSPTHTSTPVRIDCALQFVPKNTDPREFKKLQQQIKDNRRADKITSGPQSHILEGVSWEEAKKLQDANISVTGDQVILVGAASKGIIQRGFQHNAMVYKTPYAKNPFDTITDEEIEEYKKVVERKQRGESFDEDQSESEPLSSSLQNSRPTNDESVGAIKSPLLSPTSAASETEEESRDEPRVLRIETKQVPRPSQAEVVLSDAESDFPDPNVERSMSLRYPGKVPDATDVSSQFKRSWSLGREKIKSKDGCGHVVNQYAQQKIDEDHHHVPNLVRYLIARYNKSIPQRYPLLTSIKKRELPLAPPCPSGSSAPDLMHTKQKIHSYVVRSTLTIPQVDKLEKVLLKLQSKVSNIVHTHPNSCEVTKLNLPVQQMVSHSNILNLTTDQYNLPYVKANHFEIVGVADEEANTFRNNLDISIGEEAKPCGISGAGFTYEETEPFENYGTVFTYEDTDADNSKVSVGEEAKPFENYVIGITNEETGPCENYRSVSTIDRLHKNYLKVSISDEVKTYENNEERFINELAEPISIVASEDSFSDYLDMLIDGETRLNQSHATEFLNLRTKHFKHDITVYTSEEPDTEGKHLKISVGEESKSCKNSITEFTKEETERLKSDETVFMSKKTTDYLEGFITRGAKPYENTTELTCEDMESSANYAEIFTDEAETIGYSQELNAEAANAYKKYETECTCKYDATIFTTREAGTSKNYTTLLIGEDVKPSETSGTVYTNEGTEELKYDTALLTDRDANAFETGFVVHSNKGINPFKNNSTGSTLSLANDASELIIEDDGRSSSNVEFTVSTEDERSESHRKEFHGEKGQQSDIGLRPVHNELFELFAEKEAPIEIKAFVHSSEEAEDSSLTLLDEQGRMCVIEEMLDADNSDAVVRNGEQKRFEKVVPVFDHKSKSTNTDKTIISSESKPICTVLTGKKDTNLENYMMACNNEIQPSHDPALLSYKTKSIVVDEALLSCNTESTVTGVTLFASKTVPNGDDATLLTLRTVPPEDDTALLTLRTVSHADDTLLTFGTVPPGDDTTVLPLGTVPPGDDVTVLTLGNVPPGDDATVLTLGTVPPGDDATVFTLGTVPPGDDATVLTLVTVPPGDDATVLTLGTVPPGDSATVLTLGTMPPGDDATVLTLGTMPPGDDATVLTLGTVPPGDDATVLTLGTVPPGDSATVLTLGTVPPGDSATVLTLGTVPPGDSATVLTLGTVPPGDDATVLTLGTVPPGDDATVLTLGTVFPGDSATVLTLGTVPPGDDATVLPLGTVPPGDDATVLTLGTVPPGDDATVLTLGTVPPGDDATVLTLGTVPPGDDATVLTLGTVPPGDDATVLTLGTVPPGDDATVLTLGTVPPGDSATVLTLGTVPPGDSATVLTLGTVPPGDDATVLTLGTVPPGDDATVLTLGTVPPGDDATVLTLGTVPPGDSATVLTLGTVPPGDSATVLTLGTVPPGDDATVLTLGTVPPGDDATVLTLGTVPPGDDATVLTLGTVPPGDDATVLTLGTVPPGDDATVLTLGTMPPGDDATVLTLGTVHPGDDATVLTLGTVPPGDDATVLTLGTVPPGDSATVLTLGTVPRGDDATVLPLGTVPPGDRATVLTLRTVPPGDDATVFSLEGISPEGDAAVFTSEIVTPGDNLTVLTDVSKQSSVNVTICSDDSKLTVEDKAVPTNKSRPSIGVATVCSDEMMLFERDGTVFSLESMPREDDAIVCSSEMKFFEGDKTVYCNAMKLFEINVATLTTETSLFPNDAALLTDEIIESSEQVMIYISEEEEHNESPVQVLANTFKTIQNDVFDSSKENVGPSENILSPSVDSSNSFEESHIVSVENVTKPCCNFETVLVIEEAVPHMEDKSSKCYVAEPVEEGVPSDGAVSVRANDEYHLGSCLQALFSGEWILSTAQLGEDNSLKFVANKINSNISDIEITSKCSSKDMLNLVQYGKVAANNDALTCNETKCASSNDIFNPSDGGLNIDCDSFSDHLVEFLTADFGISIDCAEGALSARSEQASNTIEASSIVNTAWSDSSPTPFCTKDPNTKSGVCIVQNNISDNDCNVKDTSVYHHSTPNVQSPNAMKFFNSSLYCKKLDVNHSSTVNLATTTHTFSGECLTCNPTDFGIFLSSAVFSKRLHSLSEPALSTSSDLKSKSPFRSFMKEDTSINYNPISPIVQRSALSRSCSYPSLKPIKLTYDLRPYYSFKQKCEVSKYCTHCLPSYPVDFATKYKGIVQYSLPDSNIQFAVGQLNSELSTSSDAEVSGNSSNLSLSSTSLEVATALSETNISPILKCSTVEYYSFSSPVLDMEPDDLEFSVHFPVETAAEMGCSAHVVAEVDNNHCEFKVDTGHSSNVQLRSHSHIPTTSKLHSSSGQDLPNVSVEASSLSSTAGLNRTSLSLYLKICFNSSDSGTSWSTDSKNDSDEACKDIDDLSYSNSYSPNGFCGTESQWTLEELVDGQDPQYQQDIEEVVGSSESMQNLVEIAGCPEATQCLVEIAGSSEPTQRLVEIAGSSEPTQRLVEIAGSSEPIQRLVEIAGSSEPTQRLVEIAGSSEPTQRLVEIAGSSESTQRLVEIAGSTESTQRLAEVAGSSESTPHLAEIVGDSESTQHLVEIVGDSESTQRLVEIVGGSEYTQHLAEIVGDSESLDNLAEIVGGSESLENLEDVIFGSEFLVDLKDVVSGSEFLEDLKEVVGSSESLWCLEDVGCPKFLQDRKEVVKCTESTQDLEPASYPEFPQDLEPASYPESPQDLEPVGCPESPQDLEPVGCPESPQDLGPVGCPESPQGLGPVGCPESPHDLEPVGCPSSPQYLKVVQGTESSQDIEEIAVCSASMPDLEGVVGSIESHCALVEVLDGTESQQDSVKIVDGTESNQDSVDIVDGTESQQDSVNIVDGTEYQQDSVNIVDGTESQQDSANIVDGTESQQDSANIVDGTESQQDSVNIVDGPESQQDSVDIVDGTESQQDSVDIVDGAESQQDSVDIVDGAESQHDSVDIVDGTESQQDSVDIIDGPESHQDFVDIVDGPESHQDSVDIVDGPESQQDSVDIVDGAESQQDSVDIVDGAESQQDSVDIVDGTESQQDSVDIVDGPESQQDSVDIVDGPESQQDSVDIVDGPESQPDSVDIVDGAASQQDSVDIVDGAASQQDSVDIVDGAESQQDSVDIVDGPESHQDSVVIVDGTESNQDSVDIVDGTESHQDPEEVFDGTESQQDPAEVVDIYESQHDSREVPDGSECKNATMEIDKLLQKVVGRSEYPQALGEVISGSISSSESKWDIEMDVGVSEVVSVHSEFRLSCKKVVSSPQLPWYSEEVVTSCELQGDLEGVVSGIEPQRDHEEFGEGSKPQGEEIGNGSKSQLDSKEVGCNPDLQHGAKEVNGGIGSQQDCGKGCGSDSQQDYGVVVDIYESQWNRREVVDTSKSQQDCGGVLCGSESELDRNEFVESERKKLESISCESRHNIGVVVHKLSSLKHKPLAESGYFSSCEDNVRSLIPENKCNLFQKNELATLYFGHGSTCERIDTFFIGNEHTVALLSPKRMSPLSDSVTCANSPRCLCVFGTLPRVLDGECQCYMHTLNVEPSVEEFNNLIDSLDYSPIVHPMALKDGDNNLGSMSSEESSESEGNKSSSLSSVSLSFNSTDDVSSSLLNFEDDTDQD